MAKNIFASVKDAAKPFESVPAYLKERKQWLMWKLEIPEGQTRQTKVHTGRTAGVKQAAMIHQPGLTSKHAWNPSSPASLRASVLPLPKVTDLSASTSIIVMTAMDNWKSGRKRLLTNSLVPMLSGHHPATGFIFGATAFRLEKSDQKNGNRKAQRRSKVSSGITTLRQGISLSRAMLLMVATLPIAS